MKLPLFEVFGPCCYSQGLFELQGLNCDAPKKNINVQKNIHVNTSISQILVDRMRTYSGMFDS